MGKNAGMSTAQFKEECRGWSMSKEVLAEGFFEPWEKMIRDDFTLFDEYPGVPQPVAEDMKLQCPVHTFVAKDDRRATRPLVEGWSRITTDSVTMGDEIDGHHLFVMDVKKKETWFRSVTAHLQLWLESEIKTI